MDDTLSERWIEAGVQGPGYLTTDFHGDIRAFEYVEERFRKDQSIRWWIDLGDKGDSEKGAVGDPKLPIDGDLQILERLRQLRRAIVHGDLGVKTYLEILGNHDEGDLDVYRLLRDNDLLDQRFSHSLSQLLEKVAERESWKLSRAKELGRCRKNKKELVRRLALKDPGLSMEDATLKFYIHMILCQHGFAIRMQQEDYNWLADVHTLVMRLPLAGVVLAHGGIPVVEGDPREIACSDSDVARAYYWARYGDDYSLDDVKRFLEQVESNLLIVGHTAPVAVVKRDPENSRIVGGVAVSGEQFITFNTGCWSKSTPRCFLELDASQPVRGLSDIKVHEIPRNDR